MRILFATSEAHPLIKTGGLADVSGALPAALQSLDQEVRVILPAYPQVLDRIDSAAKLASISLGGFAVKLLLAKMPDSDVPLYLVDAPECFGRAGNPYVGPDGNDWPDNAQRFSLFARTIVALAQGQAGDGWLPDVVHCHDWQTALAPALLAQATARPATVFTIHNLAYQGLFSYTEFETLGLPATLWSPDSMEFHDQFSFIKGGLVHADRITTVSPTYAGEICTAEFGYGLEGLLQYRGADLVGILNGVDYSVWNPETDAALKARYSVDALDGKGVNKKALQEEFGLPASADALLMGQIGRLVPQKGVDLILDILPTLLEFDVQLVVLGSGDPDLEQRLQEAAVANPDQLAVFIGYDEPLAHRIEAGADLFLMPSRFEPCGLNQMYSLRYGTLPVVRATGGLADTVVHAGPDAIAGRTANGFSFVEANAQALLDTVLQAEQLWRENRKTWRQLMETAMMADFSWDRSARAYLELYRDIATLR